MATRVTVDDIVREARRLTDARGAPILAAFDADGTLWRGDIGEAAFARAAAHDMVTRDVLTEAIAPWARRYGIALDDDVARALDTLARALDDGTFERSGERLGQTKEATLTDVYAMQAWCYGGRSLDELARFAVHVFDETIRAGVFAHTARLFDALRALDVRIAVVTASPELLVRPVLDALGHADIRVLGMSTVVDEGRVRPLMRHVFPYGSGKVRALELAFARGPDLAFGDTVAGGDKNMLESAARAVAVAPRGIHREAADAWDALWLLETGDERGDDT